MLIFASIYQLSSDFVKQLFRIQIQKGGKVLLWNQVKSRMEACYSELILCIIFSKNNIHNKMKYPVLVGCTYFQGVEKGPAIEVHSCLSTPSISKSWDQIVLVVAFIFKVQLY